MNLVWGGVPGPGGMGVSAPGGCVYLVLGGVYSRGRGVSALGVSAPGGHLVWGDVCLLPGGVRYSPL